MKLVCAPEQYDETEMVSVFLAGSIEMGKAGDWQSELVDEFSSKRIMFLNPRRTDWDSSWEQTIDNEQFHEQVSWELDGLERCDIIFLYLDPETKSPISLMELGLHAQGDKPMVVCCPEGFYRKGNVDIVCEAYDVLLYDDLDKAKVALEVLWITNQGQLDV